MKIKGKKQTVFRFFLCSLAYTSVWITVSSQLSYWRDIYGPQILLLLNLAYYLPSIPLLLLSALTDKLLIQKLGVARTIQLRLLLGLGGYGAVCAAFPFLPQTIWALLSSVVALGLFSGVAFSASYQLVSRYANKNVIALGLGCSASGPLVLVLQLALGMAPASPTHRQQVALYGSIALLVAAGLWATLGLLLRHWHLLEAAAAEEDLREALLPAVIGGSPGSPAAAQGTLLSRQASLPCLVKYNQLQPYDTYLGRQDWSRRGASWDGGSLLGGDGEEGGEDSSVCSSGAATPARAFAPVRAFSATEAERRAERGAGQPDAERLPAAAWARDPAAAPLVPGPPPAAAAAAADLGGSSTAQLAAAALRDMWPAMAALSLSSIVAISMFPFFTYIPSSGLLGESLAEVLFFSRIFADLAGRFLPRLRWAVVENPLGVLGMAGLKLGCAPLFFLYLKSGPEWHSDVGAVAFISFVWFLGGYLNTMANMLAPRLVQPALKGTAAALMALAYQAANFCGLALATGIAVLMYGHITP